MGKKRRRRRASQRPTAPSQGRSAEAPALAPPAGGRHRDLLLALLIVLATSVAYGPAYRAGYIWDDADYVTENPNLADADGLARIWLDPSATPQYYPLVHTSYWVEHQLWGLDPAGYHAVNVALHALAAVVLWRILLALGLPGALPAALLFALHPVHVESVAWITERKNVLSGLFFLLALLAFLRFEPPREEETATAASQRWTAWAASLVLFAAALLSKTVTASLPAVILVLHWWKEGRLRPRVVTAVAPMFALGAAFAWLTVRLEAEHVGATGTAFDLSLVERCLIAGRALWFYAAKLVWPTDLTFIYPRWAIDAGSPSQLLYPAAAVAAAVALWLARRRIGRGPLAAGLLFGGVLLPALGFVNVYPMRFSFVADHFQYLASVPILTAIAVALDRVARRLLAGASPARRSLVAAALVAALLSPLAWQRSLAFTDAETLWRDTLAKNPDAWLAHNNLAALLFGRGELEAAERHFRTALELEPGYPHAHTGLGNILFETGRHDEAAEHFAALVRINPRNASARNNLGFIRIRQGRLDEARTHLEAAIAENPDYATAHRNLANLAFHQGRHGDAVRHFEEVLRLEPDDGGSRVRLALALERLGRTGEAVERMREQLARDPADVPALTTLARLLATAVEAGLRDGAEAVRLAGEAARLTELRSPVVLDVLAAAYAEAGAWSEAAATAGRAADLAAAAGRPEAAELYRDHQRRFAARLPLRGPPREP